MVHPPTSTIVEQASQRVAKERPVERDGQQMLQVGKRCWDGSMVPTYPTKNVHRAAHHALAVEVACTMSSMYCVWVGGVLGGAGWRFFTQLRLTCQNLRVRANDRAACLRAPLTPLTHTTLMAGCRRLFCAPLSTRCGPALGSVLRASMDERQELRK